MSWRGIIVLIGCFSPILQAQNLTREELTLIKEVQKVCQDLNELVQEQTQQYKEMVRAYDTWSTTMNRDRKIRNLRKSKPPDWESLQSDISEARERWWEVTKKVHKAEERLSHLLDRLF